MSLINQVKSWGYGDTPLNPVHRPETHLAYLDANNLDHSYRSPYSTLSPSVFDKQPNWTEKRKSYAPFNPIGNYMNQYGWKDSKSRDAFRGNMYGHIPEKWGGGVTAGEYILKNGLDIRNPRDWAKLRDAIGQYKSGFNPGGKTMSPFDRDYYVMHPGAIAGVDASSMPRDMYRAYRASRYQGYDNGLRSPYGSEAGARSPGLGSQTNGILQNEAWNDVTGGMYRDDSVANVDYSDPFNPKPM